MHRCSWGARAVLCTLEAEAPGQTPELRQSEVLIRAKPFPAQGELVRKFAHEEAGGWPSCEIVLILLLLTLLLVLLTMLQVVSMRLLLVVEDFWCFFLS